MRRIVLSLFGLCLVAPLVTAQDGGWRIEADYLTWWMRRGYVPAVLTTGTPESQGVLGQPGTRTIYGDERLETRHSDRFMGVRFAVEYVDRCSLGIEGRAFFMERDSTYRTIDPTTALLALPFTDGRTGQQTSEVIAGPSATRGLLTGGFVGYSNIELFGEEGNLVIPLVNGSTRVDLLAGARFLQMRNRYHHTATSREMENPNFEPGAVLTGVVDNYRVHNAYYGGQIGIRAETDLGRWFVQGRATAGLGADVITIKTKAERIRHTPVERIATNTGLFVQSSNQGTFHRTKLDGVGEVGLNVGYRLTEWLDVHLGYTFLLWLNPSRATEQVDTVVNPTPGATRPTIPFEGDAFWAQGLNVGATVRW